MTKQVAKVLVVFCLVSALVGITCVRSQDDRETWQPPEQILDAIGVEPGMVIGEAGAGSGYFTFPLAQRVGDQGKVYANDISESSLEKLRARAEEEKVSNIEIVLGEVDDPLFPDEEMDMIVMVYVLHHLDRPMEFLGNLKKYLKTGIPLVIIERNTDEDRAHPPSFMSKKQVLETMQEGDYELIRTETFLPKDTIYIFRLASGAPATDPPS